MGGRFGKVKGFDFYIQDREKIRPFQRRILLKKSEMYIHEIKNKLNLNSKSTEQLIRKSGSLFELDSSHHDLELMEHWNEIYDEYGYLIDDFKDKWEREMIGTIKVIGNKKDESKISKPIKMDWFKNRKNNINLRNMG